MPVRPFDDHLAQIDADAHVDALILGEALVPLPHAALDVGGAFDRIDDAGELGQKPIAHQLEDCAVTGRDRRLDQFRPVGLKSFEGSSLVLFHQAAVADDVGGEDCGELSLHERALLAAPQ